MQARDYFPLGLATGEAFCNRKAETELLVTNMQDGKHTLLMAPRRYGKSSLCLHAIQISNLPYTEIDFYMARNEKVIEKYILNGIIDLIGRTLGSVDKLINSIKRYVKRLKPKLEIGTHAITLELSTDENTDPATNVTEGLLLLEQLLNEKQKCAILFLDEFQNVGLIAKGSGIEAAIRHVAQKTKYLAIVFSGSNRRLLQTMFEDDTRPLYKLCWKIDLHRIAFEHYKKHFLKASKLAWARDIEEDFIKEIAALTELHPYYFNKLADRLLTYQNIPNIIDVKVEWEKVLEEEKSDAVKEISNLSIGQKNVLLHIAKETHKTITGKHSTLALQTSSSSIMAALNALEEKDVIEKIDGHYNIINPVVKYYVLKNG